jgi:RNA polymerase sigma-70 factor (ECF subfamily)
MEEVQESLKHLFQQEFSKMVAVITKLFGLPYIEIAEDIVGETFLLATESWALKGLPPNPEAWLYAVAKQKTLYHFRRNKIFDTKVAPELQIREENKQEIAGFDFSAQRIKDSQLQMMFAICSPVIASEAQIGLALRILCGFGIEEIAEAFLSNKDTINKRLFRAKEKLRREKIKMELPQGNEIATRLDNVLRIIYLLFNEGYYSKTQNRILRKELCLEAMRLCLMLTEYEKTNLPQTNALMALMCFHASRFEARKGKGVLILYEQQNEELWDKELISRGMYFLDLSASGTAVSTYHLEAKIAFWHCIKEDSREKWEDILKLYDQLLNIHYSPVVALNRVFALYKVKGVQAALPEAEKLSFINNHFYFVLLGELCKNEDRKKAKHHFQKAYGLAATEAEREYIYEKITRVSGTRD